ncbi:MAG TPA: FHA domain-containing protein [Planctomycetota bacterium]|nr:FHA domain-containing protein [Planctomycetota bacterium]
MAKLILRVNGVGKEFDLERTGSLTVGRSPDCDITIDDTQASRRHCTVIRLQSGYEVSDLGSTNGTLVNSTLVKKQKLRHGDVIRIGAVEIAFDDPGSAGAAGEPAVGYLVYAKGDRKGEKIELSAQRTTIGRKPTNTVVIDDPVSSSYHCEIVRGLNGYAIRDLGSTNGTLVNSEMVTEAQLSHGARIRIGNTRFVFQDPAMAEIDLELAGAAEDDEWGMMRDIDLAAVRKRNPATIAYALLFVAIVGAGGYFLAVAKPRVEKGGPAGPEGNLHAPWSFEAEGAALTWAAEPEAAVTLTTSTQVKKTGDRSLEIRANTPEAVAYYAQRFRDDRAAYRIKGSVAARGTKARFGIRWMGGAGIERWATGPAVEGSMRDVDLVASCPPWATSALLGVELDGAGTVDLDDVSIVREGAAHVEEVTINAFRLFVTDGRAADLFHDAAAVLVNGHPFARDAQGNPVDAPGLRIAAAAADEEHMLLTVEGAGDAATAGIEFDETGGYLSRGGFRAFTPSAKEGKTFHPAFPDDGVLALEDVRKLLLGPSGRSFAVLPGTDGGRLDAEARVQGKTRSVALLGPAADGKFAFRFKVDLRGETTLAASTMANVLSLHGQRRYGEFLAEGARALAEFPFANKTTRDEIRKLIDEVNADYEARRKKIDRLTKDYVDFRNLEDLQAAGAELGKLEKDFQTAAFEGPRSDYGVKAREEIERLALAARVQRETKLTDRTFVQATLVDLPDGRVFSAALQLYYITEFAPNAGTAPAAAAALQQIYKDCPQIERVLDGLFGKKPR